MPPLGFKQTEAGFRARKLSTRMQTIEDSDSEIPLPNKKQKKRGRTKSQDEKLEKYPKSKIGEDLDDVQQTVGHELRAHWGHKRRVTLLKLIKLLGETAAALSQLGGREEVEEAFQLVEDEEAVELIRKHCKTISDLLPRSDSASRASSGRIPDEFYDQSFIYRASSSLLYLLRPVEVFKGTIKFNRRKVFGYVRSQYCSQPLMCALPGWTKCVEKHPKLLEPALWTDVVKDLVNFHNYAFKRSPFDRYHGRDDGDTYAAHVEPRLMIWFALDLLQKTTGQVRTPLTQIGDLWRLRHTMQETVEAQIVLSRNPCKECLTFQDFMEAYTPIRFMFIVCKNLAEVEFQTNKHSQKSLPLFAPEIEDSEPESESEPQMVEERPKTLPRSRVAVVIREKSSGTSGTPAATARPVKNQTKSSQVPFSTTMTPQENSRSGLSTKITFSQAANLHHCYHTPKSPEPKKIRQRRYGDGTDEQEWKPARSKSKTRNDDMLTPVRKVTRNVILTPDSTPFGFDALEQAQNIRKHKRKNLGDQDYSPTPAKKNRLGQF